ncbi:hypothetical protein PFISCL1PPCAC_1629, partial [Pristionchus fissidentatus]
SFINIRSNKTISSYKPVARKENEETTTVNHRVPIMNSEKISQGIQNQGIASDRIISCTRNNSECVRAKTPSRQIGWIS